jgi:serine/threonine-protein kinase
MDQYIGKLLDNRYEILDMIGVGGMAMVYKAYCHRLHRFVAVKILRKDLASDSEFRRRFHDEAQAVAMLSHPNIVSVYDVSRGEDLDYIVMELIDGITLKQYMKKKGGSLTWREALHYITQIMRALSHAHSRGIIHRDIKPQNILVLRDGSVRVADFGIARIMSAAQNTLTQEALGSVHYISPEQARGSHIDDRADIYSAGVVLYEMLTGRLPFEGDSPVSVAIQHISSIPLSPRELNQDIPEALEAITLKAMASNVDQRYKNAEEMIHDLEEFRKNPNVVFGYEHHGMMMQTDEPTQILESTGSIGKNKPVSRLAGTHSLDQHEYEIYDEYRNTGVRNPSKGNRKGKNTAMIPIIAVVSVFLIGVSVFLWIFFFSDLFKTTDTMIIPNCIGKTIEEVMADESITSRFDISKDVKSEPSDTYAKGQIINQSPEPDTQMKGDRIELSFTVSSGQDFVTMIDVTNMSYSEAMIKLENLGLVLKEPEYQYNDDVVIHHVISSWPPLGTKMMRGDSVQLVVSRGPEVKMVTVPSLYTLSQSEAEKMLLQDYNLKCNVIQIPSDEDVGTVINQSIAPTTQVEVGTTITIQVSKGPAENVVNTKTITISLPDEPDTVTLQVKVGGAEQYNETVSTANGSVTIEINGSGKQEVVVYINGVEQNRYEVNFDT